MRKFLRIMRRSTMDQIEFFDLEERISAISEEDAMYKAGETVELS